MKRCVAMSGRSYGLVVSVEQTASHRRLVPALRQFLPDQSTWTPANVVRVVLTSCRGNVFRCHSLHSTSSTGSSTLAHLMTSTTSTSSANDMQSVERTSIRLLQQVHHSATASTCWLIANDLLTCLTTLPFSHLKCAHLITLVYLVVCS